MFIAITLIYTVSTISVKVASLANFGKIWAEYLVIYPVLALIEWAFPIFYLFVAVRLLKDFRSDSLSKTQGTNRAAYQSSSQAKLD